jgi:hypothetical protein
MKNKTIMKAVFVRMWKVAVLAHNLYEETVKDHKKLLPGEPI